MISIIFYFMFLINLVLVFMRKKSNFLAFCYWLVLFFVYSGNIRSGFSDLTYYRQRYYDGLNDIFFQDKGYVWLANLIYDSGFSFQYLLATIFIIASVLIYFISRQLNCNYNLLLILLSLFYFFYSLEVIRFFLAVSFAIVGYYYLSRDKKIVFILFVILASRFHVSLIFLLPFVFFYSAKQKNYRIILLIVLSLILIVLNYLNDNNSAYLVSIFGDAFGTESAADRIQFYTSNSTRLGFLIYYMYFIFNIFMITNFNKIIEELDGLNDVQSKFINCVYQQNLFCTIFLPLIMFNVTFFRYIVFTTVLNFLVYSIIYSQINMKIKTKLHYPVIASIFGFTVLWWIMKENVLMFYEALIPNIFN